MFAPWEMKTMKRGGKVGKAANFEITCNLSVL